MTPDLPPIPCEVVRVHDGDGPLTCASGVKIRIAGVQAPDFESATPCRETPPRKGYVCDDAAAERSRRIVARMTLGRTLTCQPVGRSYRRIVARCRLPDGRSLSCAVIAAGAAARWDSWWRRYRMGVWIVTKKTNRAGDCLLRMAEVQRRTGLSPASVHRRVKARTFPPKVQIGPKAVAWYQSDIDAFVSDPLGYRVAPVKTASG